MLDAAGAEGWELVGITSNNIAYLKRAADDIPLPVVHGNGSITKDANGGGEGSQVKPKYRDPVTNETWSGRGRMATWLKKKQDAGEDIEEYLV
jgi:DNA-binding protein H-NS